MRPEYLEREPAARGHGGSRASSGCVLFPAGMALAAEHYVDDTEALYANLRSFNRWYDETWGFNHDDTIYATALLSLRDLDSAVARDRRASSPRGARVVLLPTGPAYGRSPGDPYFDPVWSRLDEAGVTVALAHHAVLVLRRDLARVGPRPRPRRVAHVGVAVEEHLRRAPGRGHALGADLRQPLRSLPEPARARRRARRRVGAALRSGTWTRAAAWAATDRGSAASSRSGRARSSAATCASRPTPRTTSRGSSRTSATTTRIVMGSDFPHAEGLAEPADFAKLLDPLPADVQRADPAHQRRGRLRRDDVNADDGPSPVDARRGAVARALPGTGRTRTARTSYAPATTSDSRGCSSNPATAVST